MAKISKDLRKDFLIANIDVTCSLHTPSPYAVPFKSSVSEAIYIFFFCTKPKWGYFNCFPTTDILAVAGGSKVGAVLERVI